MAEQAAKRTRPAIRAVVVYRYPVYRDLITRVLQKAEVEVAGALGVRELSRASLRALHPDVVVIYDPDANNLLRDVAASAMMDSAENSVRRVVCVGSDNEMVVLHRLVYANPSVEGLVGCVKGVTGEVGSWARPLSEQVDDQIGQAEQPTPGSGGS